jgi:hypothetical protein
MGSKLASEVSAEKEGIGICSETPKREPIKHDLWEARPQTGRQQHGWRDRRPCSGELAWVDASLRQRFAGNPPARAHRFNDRRCRRHHVRQDARCRRNPKTTWTQSKPAPSKTGAL